MALSWDNISKCADVTLASSDTPTVVKVGGKDGKFVPNINASKWDDKAWLNINIPVTVASEIGELKDVKAEIKLGDWTHRYYEDAKGNLEYEIVMDKRPSSDDIVMNLTFPDGLEFWRQGSLAEDWAESHHGCSTYEDFLAASYKPDNVVGSYAVYWKEKNNQFKTGKFCHIYRPKVTASDGKWAWAELKIDAKAKTLTILMDKAWLDKAKYPIVLDPELGYSTQGAGTYGGGYILGGAYTTDGTGGYVTNFHVWQGAVVGEELKICISATNGSNDPSGQDMLEQMVLTTGLNSKRDGVATGETLLAASTQYWIGCVAPNGNSYYYDSGSSNKYCKYSGVVFADQFADPMSSGYSTDTYQYSQWVDYAPSGGGGVNTKVVSYYMARRRK